MKRSLRIPRRRDGALLLGLAILSTGLAQAAEVVVDTVRRGAAVEVHARAILHAPRELIWETLTDYNHLPDFIPGIRSSRLVEYRGTAAIVEQSGAAGILFFSFPIEVMLESLELAPDLIEVRVLRGNLKQLSGHYRIEAGQSLRDDLTLTWTGVIEPDMPLPPVVGEMVLRTNVADQFRGMVREIERREALRLAQASGAGGESK